MRTSVAPNTKNAKAASFSEIITIVTVTQIGFREGVAGAGRTRTRTQTRDNYMYYCAHCTAHPHTTHSQRTEQTLYTGRSVRTEPPNSKLGLAVGDQGLDWSQSILSDPEHR